VTDPTWADLGQRHPLDDAEPATDTTEPPRPEPTPWGGIFAVALMAVTVLGFAAAIAYDLLTP
jgi:hypothetical protein